MFRFASSLHIIFDGISFIKQILMSLWKFQDSQIKDILTTSPTAMTITIMPKFIYEHMIKR